MMHAITRRISLLLVLAASLWAGPAKAEPLAKEYVGVWLIQAYSYDGSTKFSHCTMRAEYDDGISLIFYLDDEYYWGIRLVGEAWRLKEGDKYDVLIGVDNDKPKRYVAEASAADWVHIEIDGSSGMFDRLRDGRKLYIDTSGQLFTFGLNGTSKGLLALFDCVDKRMRSASKTNPFTNPSDGGKVGTDANPFDPAGGTYGPASDGYRIEAQHMMKNLLQRTQITDYVLADSSELTSDTAQFAAAWTNERDLIGGLFVIPEGEKSEAERILGAMAKSKAGDCAGKFVAKTDMEARAHGAYMPRAYAGCSDGGRSTMMYFSAFQRRQGGFYVVFTMTTEGNSPNAAAEMDDRLREAAYALQ